MVQPTSSELEIAVDHATTAGACALIAGPAWMASANPYLQFFGVLLGIVWVGIQIFYKLKKGA